MNPEHHIYLVDVFTRSQYSGNPLAVIVSEQPLAATTMQKIDAEMNFSETTFVAASADADGGYATRIFTPVREIAFTGHPILGSAWVIREYVIRQPQERVSLNLGLGQVSVSFDDADAAAVCWFIAPPITFGATIEPEAIAAAVGLQPQDIDTRTPVQVVGSGTAAIILPLRDLDALRRGRLDLDRFATLADIGYPPLVYLYCAQTRATGNDFSARFFFEAREVREDPATGNGAAFLGAYLLEYATDDKAEFNLRIEQGHELGRPSLIHLRARRLDAGCEVQIGGTVIANATGKLLGADHAA
jgi:trans-2,3-dihydro-3-hydroxyanthranilate isomerase